MPKIVTLSLVRQVTFVAAVSLGFSTVKAQPSKNIVTNEAISRYRGNPPVYLKKSIPQNKFDRILKSQGPESGGGGGVVKINQTWHLVDYFLLPETLPQIQAWDLTVRADRVDAASKEPLEFYQENQTINNKAFSLALTILEEWAALPFDRLAALMLGSLQNPLRWAFVDEELFSFPPYRPPALEPDTPILTAANYTIVPHELFLVRLSRRLWNEMPLYQQTGLIIHEILRQVQFGKQSYFNDESLQKATAIYMLCKPSIKLNQYAFFLTLDSEALAIERLGTFSDITQNCRGPK